MNTNVKKAIMIFGGGFLLFLAFKKLKPFGGKGKSTRSKNSEPTESQKKNAIIAIKAYSDAKSAGESASFLDELNAEFVKQYSLRVYVEKGTGGIIATDLSGNKIA
jgi:hypothetical protein